THLAQVAENVAAYLQQIPGAKIAKIEHGGRRCGHARRRFGGNPESLKCRGERYARGNQRLAAEQDLMLQALCLRAGLRDSRKDVALGETLFLVSQPGADEYGDGNAQRDSESAAIRHWRSSKQRIGRIPRPRPGGKRKTGPVCAVVTVRLFGFP